MHGTTFNHQDRYYYYSYFSDKESMTQRDEINLNPGLRPNEWQAGSSHHNESLRIERGFSIFLLMWTPMWRYELSPRDFSPPLDLSYPREINFCISLLCTSIIHTPFHVSPTTILWNVYCALFALLNFLFIQLLFTELPLPGSATGQVSSTSCPSLHSHPASCHLFSPCHVSGTVLQDTWAASANENIRFLLLTELIF